MLIDLFIDLFDTGILDFHIFISPYFNGRFTDDLGSAWSDTDLEVDLSETNHDLAYF